MTSGCSSPTATKNTAAIRMSSAGLLGTLLQMSNSLNSSSPGCFVNFCRNSNLYSIQSQESQRFLNFYNTTKDIHCTNLINCWLFSLHFSWLFWRESKWNYYHYIIARHTCWQCSNKTKHLNTSNIRWHFCSISSWKYHFWWWVRWTRHWRAGWSTGQW